MNNTKQQLNICQVVMDSTYMPVIAAIHLIIFASAKYTITLIIYQQIWSFNAKISIKCDKSVNNLSYSSAAWLRHLSEIYHQQIIINELVQTSWAEFMNERQPCNKIGQRIQWVIKNMTYTSTDHNRDNMNGQGVFNYLVWDGSLFNVL